MNKFGSTALLKVVSLKDYEDGNALVKLKLMKQEMLNDKIENIEEGYGGLGSCFVTIC